MDSETEEKILAQRLIAAAGNLDVLAVRNLVRTTSPRVQDGETGLTPLHAAVASCADPSHSESDACAVVTLLLDEGAIWNDLDKNNKTPGCIARELGVKDVYQLIVNAGIRAELIFNKMGEIDGSDGGDDDEADDDAATRTAIEEDGTAAENPAMARIDASNGTQEDSISVHNAGVENAGDPKEDYIDHWDSNADFLRSSLRFTDTQLLDSSSNAVMMDWETEIMSKHAARLLPRPGLRAMNIGHGMGIVDAEIQSHEPAEHHIVEAHPAVLRQMRKNGWYEKPGVVIHEGRWQDILPRLVENGLELDAIYYDTFAESYQDLKELFEENVIGLLDRSGRFGFYNGLGADRQVCYDVYTNVVELDLLDAGLKTEWEELAVPTIDWNGIRRPYWNIDVYRLPTCTFIG